MRIDPGTSVGGVELVVADLDGQAAYYREAIGLQERGRTSDVVELGAPDGDGPLVTLVHRPDAPPRPRRSTGLFHLALLVPSRVELARAVHRVTAAGRRFTGASDHLVSEALYLDDPEGNGIEIYRDRPRDGWPRENGELQMATLPLDLEGVLASDGADEASREMAAGTRMGHVHLQVADIGAAEEFYVGVLGFDPVVRRYPGALFVSAGGYHHHFGLNTWAGVGAPAPSEGSRGLKRLTVVLPDGAALEAALGSVSAAGIDVVADDDGQSVVADPSGNRIALVVR